MATLLIVFCDERRRWRLGRAARRGAKGWIKECGAGAASRRAELSRTRAACRGNQGPTWGGGPEPKPKLHRGAGECRRHEQESVVARTGRASQNRACHL